MSLRIQLRRDTAANWTSADPVLAEGELGINLTDWTYKIGDGSTAWSSLTAYGGAGGVSDGDKGDITVSSSGTVWTIDNGAVTLAKQANVATSRIMGRVTAGSGVQEALTGTQATTLLDAFTSGLKGLAPASGGGTSNYLRADGTWAAPSAGGVSDGDKGDVTVSSSGAVWTIDAGVVTLAKQADMATASVVYRKTAGSGAPEVQTLATLKTDLGLTGTNSGDQTSVSGNAGSATVLQTSRNFSISGGGITAATVGFDGSAAVVLNASVDAGHITLARMADVATGTIFYRKTAGTGAPEVQTLATLKTDLGLTGTNSGDQTSIVGITGTKAQFDTACTDGNFLYSGDVTQYTDEMAQDAIGAMLDGSLVYVDATPLLQRAALTGDVTASAGSNATTIAAGAVTLAKMADIATGSLLYRKTAGTGSPEVQTLATLKTDLGLTGTNSGDQTITLTGDVTGSGTGSFAATVGNGVVTLAKMANIATASFIGRVTAGTGVPEALTGTQATTLLDAFTSGLKGLAPASGGGTSNFLRADGTWAAPPGGGGGLSDGDYGDITVSGTGTIMTIDAGVVTYAKMQDVSATDKLLGRSTAGAGDVEEIACTAAGRALLDDASAAAQATTLGLGTGDSPQFTAINIGHASDTTLARSGAGDLSVEGNAIYRAGGTDVPVADGGTGASTAAAARVNILPSMTGNSLKVLRVNVGETDFELATAGGGSGDFSGPGSSTDNAIVRFDGTGGKTGQNSAATIDDDGVIRSATNSGANAVGVPLVNWIQQDSDYTLTSTTSSQKIFNESTNGTLTLPTGVYRFEVGLFITSMSATSGNCLIDMLGAGTAVTGRWLWQAVGIDNSNADTVANARHGSMGTSSTSIASIITAVTGTKLNVTISGMFAVSTGGTLIPSLSLVTAAAAVVKSGSYMHLDKIGETGETYLGAWT